MFKKSRETTKFLWEILVNVICGNPYQNYKHSGIPFQTQGILAVLERKTFSVYIFSFITSYLKHNLNGNGTNMTLLRPIQTMLQWSPGALYIPAWRFDFPCPSASGYRNLSLLFLGICPQSFKKRPVVISFYQTETKILTGWAVSCAFYNNPYFQCIVLINCRGKMMVQVLKSLISFKV